LLAELEGGCQVPVGALAKAAPDGRLHLSGGVFSLDGRETVRAAFEADVPDEAAAVALGRAVAARLRGNGADAILAQVRAASAGDPAPPPEP
jgi:hydroxymethylbilane synthase